MMCVLLLLIVLAYTNIVMQNAGVGVAGSPTSRVPGGGTSLQFPPDPSVALLRVFTALSNASSFSVEFWAYSRSYGNPATALAFCTPTQGTFFQVPMWSLWAAP